VRRAALPGLLALVILRLPSFMEPHWYTDEAGYSNVARQLLQGKVLYSQTWNNKPPGMLWTIALEEKLFGTSEAGLHLLTLATGLITISAIVWAGSHLFTPKRAMVAGLLAAVILGLPLVDAELALPESLMIAPLSWAGAIVLVRILRGDVHDAPRRIPRWPIAVGVLMALAISYQQTAIAETSAFFLAMLLAPTLLRRDAFIFLTTAGAITLAWLGVAIITAGAGTVAFALAGSMDWDPINEPIGRDGNGVDVYMRDLWPTSAEIGATVAECVAEAMFRREYADAFGGDERWKSLEIQEGTRFAWAPGSTYVKRPPFFDGMPVEPAPRADITGARVLAVLGDSVTTDHISPAGSIGKDSPAGAYLIARGIEHKDFNSYGARRGNHEVMMRGTFANIRLRNRLAPGTEGGFTRHLPDGELMSIFDASLKYLEEGVPLVVIAGKEYGSGSSRDWAAKGPRLLGVRAVIAESFERIHRSNLIGMGIVPLQFENGQTAATLDLTGEESVRIAGIAQGVTPGKTLTVTAVRPDGTITTFKAMARIDTPDEAEYYRHDGILQYVLRQLRSGQ